MTIASMIPVELSKMSRWAAAMGPGESSTPREQPPSVAAPINETASAKPRISDPLAGKESREQHKQVQDGKRKDVMRRGSIGSVAPNQFQCERNECRAADCSGCAIDSAGKSKRPWQQRNREPHYALNPELTFCRPPPR